MRSVPVAMRLSHMHVWFSVVDGFAAEDALSLLQAGEAGETDGRDGVEIGFQHGDAMVDVHLAEEMPVILEMQYIGRVDHRVDPINGLMLAESGIVDDDFDSRVAFADAGREFVVGRVLDEDEAARLVVLQERIE